MPLRQILIWLVKVLFVIGALCSINYLVLSKYVNNIKIPTNREIIRDSLVRDTLYHTKDSLTNKIITIKESYEKEKAVIVANDTTADMQFFTSYINNYSRTTKDN